MPERVLVLNSVYGGPNHVIPVRSILFVEIGDESLTIYLVGTPNTISTDFQRHSRSQIQELITNTISGRGTQ